MQQYLQNIDPRLVFAVCVFGAVTLIVFVVMGLLFRKEVNPVKERIQPRKPPQTTRHLRGKEFSPLSFPAPFP